jgi:hypothetical protein
VRACAPAVSPDAADRADDHGHQAEEAVTDPFKLAGRLLVIAVGFELATWAIIAIWGFRPTWYGIADTTLRLLVGVGLLRKGAKLRRTALWLLPLPPAFPLLQLVFVNPSFDYRFVARFIAYPLTRDLVRLAPMFGLLLGHARRRRIKLAIAGFVLAQLILAADETFRTYMLVTSNHWTK